MARGVKLAGWCLVLTTLIGVPIITFGEPRFQMIMFLIPLTGAGLALVLERLGFPKVALLFLVLGHAPLVKLWGGTSLVIITSTRHWLAGTVAALDLVLLILILIRARKAGWAFVLAAPAVVFSLHSVFALGSVAHLFRPVDPDACRALEEQPGVTWVSHGHGGAGQDIWVDASGDGVYATFKSPTNLLMPWAEGERPSAIAFFPHAGEGAGDGVGVPVGPELEPWEMPEFMWIDQDGALWATVLREKQGHAILYAADPRGLKGDDRHRFIDFDGEPNGLFEFGDHVVAWRDRVEVVWYERETLREDAPRWYRPERFESPLHNLLDLDFDGEGHAYFITFTGDVWELDVAGRASRYVTPTLSGGGIDVEPTLDRIAVGDMVGHTVTVLDRSTLETLAQRYVAFTARPVRIVPELKAVFAGDYMTGSLASFRVDDLEPQGDPIYVGRTLRRLKWDTQHQALYAASSCGLVRIDPAKAFGDVFEAAAAPQAD